MKHYLLVIIGLLVAFHSIAKDFKYTYQGKTLWYLITDENAKTCEVRYQLGDISMSAPSGKVVIPSIVKYEDVEYTVTSIQNGAFRWCSGLTEVIIPSTVTSIGDIAFTHCSSLTQVTIPNTVISIGTNPFANCINLTAIRMGINGFKYDFEHNLWKEAKVKVQTTWFADGGWAELAPQPTVELTPTKGFTFTAPEATGNDQWQGQVHIGTNIPVKAGVTYDFSCNITVPKDGAVTVKPQMDGDDNVYFTADRVNVSAGGSIVWFSDVEGFDGTLKIAFDFAGFGGCTITVDNIVFKEHQYDDGTMNGGSFTSKDGVLYNKDMTKLIAFPGGESSVDIPNTVNSICDWAFMGCEKIYALTIPNSVSSIGYGAFGDCTSLKKLTITNSITDIGREAFDGCSAMNSVYYETKNPIEGNSNIFSNYAATLYVPEEAVAKCKTIDPWKNFKKIEVYDFSGIDDVVDDGDGVRSCEVYNLNGVRIADSTDSLAPGMYIVRQGSTVKKVIIN